MFGKNLRGELYFALPCIALFFAILSFSGCDNSTQSNPNVANVKGRIAGMFGLPIPGVSVLAKTNSALTDIYGRFDLGSVQSPFNLAVFDTVKKKCVYIPGRSNANSDRIYLNYTGDPLGYVTSVVNISYPQNVVQSYAGKSLFTDFNDRNFPGEITQTGSTISVQMYPGTQYKGAAAVVLYTFDNNSRITSYNKYCIKDNITVNAGETVNVQMTAEDFKTISGNNTYHLTINAGQDQTVNLRYAYLTFGSKQSPNYVNYIMQESISSDVFDIVIPVGIPVSNNVLIGFVSQSAGPNLSITKIYAPITGSTTINSPAVPVLVYPPENATINASAEIVFNSGLSHVENKFYKLVLDDYSGVSHKYTEYEIFLDKERFNLSELNGLGIESINGRIFNWHVEVYENLNLDEFLSENGNNAKYLAISSAGRFTVNP